MSTKKIIIIIAFVALVIGVVIFSSKKIAANAQTDNNGSGTASGTGTTGTNTTSNKYKNDDYWKTGDGDGKERYEDGETLDQSKVYLSEAQRNDIASTIHKLFDWTFSDDEFDEILTILKTKIFTRADLFAVLNHDSYVYERWYSWIINNNNKKHRIERVNQVLKTNGVDYEFTRSK